MTLHTYSRLDFEMYTFDNTEFQVLCNIKKLTSRYLDSDEMTYRYSHDGVDTRVTYGALRLIEKIKMKNDALLNSKHDEKLVRYHCKRIIHG